MAFVAEKTFTVEGNPIPDTRHAPEITRFVKGIEPALLFQQSSRAYHCAAPAGKHRGLKFDRDLLYSAATFHDMVQSPAPSTAHERSEVDGTNAARDFLRRLGSDRC